MNEDKKGYNPLHWNCLTQGCFNYYCRPRLEMFAHCFPGKICMSDIDGICEINKHFLLLEWKTQFKPLPQGQKILFERISKAGKFTVLVLVGNVQDMKPHHLQWFHNGHSSKMFSTDAEYVENFITRWANMAKKGVQLSIVS